MTSYQRFTLQGPSQDVTLRRWVVYAKKHKRWRKVTPDRLVACILSIGGFLDLFPDGFQFEVYVPIEHEALRHGVEHHYRKIKAQVEREGRAFTLVMPDATSSDSTFCFAFDLQVAAESQNGHVLG